jgi:hypothetical protein
MSAISDFFVPDSQVEKLFRDVAAATRQSTPELMRDVMKLWVADLVRQTYPKTRNQVARRIEDETQYLFVAGEQLENSSLQAAFKRGATFDAGPLQIMPNETAENMTALRNSVRNRRGRVTKRPGVKVKAVKMSVLKRHLRTQKRHIGRLKAGWAKAAEWANVSLPSWVPTDTERGLFNDAINVQTLEGALTAENSVPYAVDRLKGQFMDWLLRKRVIDMTSGKYAMRWEKKMKREFEARGGAAARGGAVT